MATTCAVGTSLGLNSLVKHMPPLVGRFVPFVAVAAANSVNIPMMRKQFRSLPFSHYELQLSSRELNHGVTLLDERGKELAHSPKTAKLAIAQVIASRIGMAAPGMGKVEAIEQEQTPFFQ